MSMPSKWSFNFRLPRAGALFWHLGARYFLRRGVNALHSANKQLRSTSATRGHAMPWRKAISLTLNSIAFNIIISH
jgi:hypothetical protein